MEIVVRETLRRQLEDRRLRLYRAVERGTSEDHLVDLLGRVDAALDRLGTEEYGRCVVCDERVEERDLRANPLLEYCLCDLSPQQQRALEHDLGLARRIQAGLLPDPDLGVRDWTSHYLYEPSGVVSGDHCDLWVSPDDPQVLHFVVADVSGKGVAASLLMAHLQAAFRSLIGAGVPLDDLVVRVNRQLIAANLATHYATLACGRATPDGWVSLVNAGHCPPLVVRSYGVEPLAPSGLPVGLLDDRTYGSKEIHLAPGESLVIYTDGLSEARDRSGHEFGTERIEAALVGSRFQDPQDLVRGLRADVGRFTGGVSLADDLTVLALRHDPR